MTWAKGDLLVEGQRIRMCDTSEWLVMRVTPRTSATVRCTRGTGVEGSRVVTFADGRTASFKTYSGAAKPGDILQISTRAHVEQIGEAL